LEDIQSLELDFPLETKIVANMNYSLLSTILVIISTGKSIVEGLSCSECIHPQFQNHPLYLPFCHKDKTYHNLCEALCSSEEEDLILESPIKGSCDKCEKKCSMIFTPICSKVSEGEVPTVFPNKCHAKCSGMEYEDCKNLPVPPVIPGKTRLPSLPLSKISPEGLQNLENF